MHDAHSPHPKGYEMNIDAQTGMLPGIPESAVCVQRFDDSLNLTIHITYRNLLRSSSLREPRHPLLAVVLISFVSISSKRAGLVNSSKR
jgi:hypothetical protein